MIPGTSLKSLLLIYPVSEKRLELYVNFDKTSAMQCDGKFTSTSPIVKAVESLSVGGKSRGFWFGVVR